jgi:hypothetical protein
MYFTALKLFVAVELPNKFPYIGLWCVLLPANMVSEFSVSFKKYSFKTLLLPLHRQRLIGVC